MISLPYFRSIKYIASTGHMHNIRKIKKKKRITRVLDSQEEIAQEKLFQISRFEEEELAITEADLFVQQLKISPPKRPLPTTYPTRILEYRHSLNSFVDQFEKKVRIPETYSSFRELRSRSSEVTSRAPIAIINYLLIDSRENRQNAHIRSKMDSLIKHKHKTAIKRNRSQDSAHSDSPCCANPQEKQISFLQEIHSNASLIKMKAPKVFNKSSGFRGRIIS